jgi:hypothetical protein
MQKKSSATFAALKITIVVFYTPFPFEGNIAIQKNDVSQKY